jgi:4'-phosphopantetheinyl transferase
MGKHGKPHFEPPSPNLAFNISHSGGYCALAMGAFPRIGVDIEALRDTVGDIAENVFTKREIAIYAAVPPPERMRVFFRGWVAKEAYLKAIGDGLVGGLKSAEFDLSFGPEITAIAIRGNTTELSRWQFRGFDVTDTIVGAVAVEASDPAMELVVRFIDADRLRLADQD